jgi:hypothetical protein
MICPNLLITTSPKLRCRCTSAVEKPEVRTGDINQYCATDQYDHCPNYQKKTSEIKKFIHREVFRAIG